MRIVPIKVTKGSENKITTISTQNQDFLNTNLHPTASIPRPTPGILSLFTPKRVRNLSCLSIDAALDVIGARTHITVNLEVSLSVQPSSIHAQSNL